MSGAGTTVSYRAAPAAPVLDEQPASRPQPIVTADRPKGTHRGGLILAPGESADDPVPGWEG
jgi:hypothetical protein